MSAENPVSSSQLSAAKTQAIWSLGNAGMGGGTPVNELRLLMLHYQCSLKDNNRTAKSETDQFRQVIMKL